jgi:hypothetical protein
MFIQDFPRSSNSQAVHTDFSRSLSTLLATMRITDGFCAAFERFDYSTSRDSVKLVVTYQGTFVGWDQIERGGGIASFATGVSGLGLSPGAKYHIEAQGSSLGALKPDWLKQMLAAASGKHPRDYVKKGSLSDPRISKTNLPIKIVYPRLEEIDGSRLGKAVCPVSFDSIAYPS